MNQRRSKQVVVRSVRRKSIDTYKLARVLIDVAKSLTPEQLKELEDDHKRKIYFEAIDAVLYPSPSRLTPPHWNPGSSDVVDDSASMNGVSGS